MNRIIILIILQAFLTACNSKPQTELRAIENLKGTAVYGDSISNESFIELAAIQTVMRDQSKKDLKIKGIVEEVCQEKGCWMTMKLDNGEEMRVTFKEYKIFVPKNIKGKEVVLDGFAYNKTEAVKDLQHFAKDAGKTEAEIAKITKPKSQLAFEAKGVVVMN